MLTVLGSLLGFAGSAVPSIIDMFKEKEDAKSLFKSRKGKDQLKDIEKRAKTFTPGEPLSEESATTKAQNHTNKLTPEQIRSIKSSIAKATTLEEIETLNHMLRTGQVPGEPIGLKNGHNNQMEEDED